MANRNIAVVVFVLFLAQWTVPANAKKITVGDDGPGHSEPDDWDKELDEEWEEWEKKSSKKKPAKEKVPEDPMEMIRRLQASNEGGGAKDAVFATAGSFEMAFLKLDPRLVTTKEEADKLAGRLTQLQRTGGFADSWYTIDHETLLIQSKGGENLRAAKNFALSQKEVYEFEFKSSKFRREEDELTYEELRESLGMPVPSPPAGSKAPPAGKKGTKKSSKKKASSTKEEKTEL